MVLSSLGEHATSLWPSGEEASSHFGDLARQLCGAASLMGRARLRRRSILPRPDTSSDPLGCGPAVGPDDRRRPLNAR